MAKDKQALADQIAKDPQLTTDTAPQKPEVSETKVNETPVSANDNIKDESQTKDLTAKTETTAPVEEHMPQPGKEQVVATPIEQSEEVKHANETTDEKPVVGKLIKPLTDLELEKELYDEKFGDFDKWIINHFEHRTATIDSLARVTRYKVTDIVNILKDAGYKFPEGF